jgi:hypothetical protein
MDKSNYFARWNSDSNVSFSDASSSFDEFLERYQPRMLLSWYSTALFDALRRGVVPVTVGTEPWRVKDVVFPFREISLQWPKERVLVEEFMSRDDRREVFLADRRALASVEART